jgi:hypothetical protein
MLLQFVQTYALFSTTSTTNTTTTNNNNNNNIQILLLLLLSCRRVRKIAKSNCYLRHVSLHGTISTPLDCFSLNMKIQVPPHPEKNWQVHYINTYVSTFMLISLSLPLRMRNVSDKICREYHNTHLYSVTFVENCAVLWDNVEEYGTVRQATDDNIIWLMRFAY